MGVIPGSGVNPFWHAFWSGYKKQDEAQFKKNLIEYKNTIMRSANAAATAIGEPAPYPGVPPASETSDIRKKADDIIRKK